MGSPVTGLIVDALGFLTGAILYLMLIAMVWRERAGEGTGFLSRRGQLPLLTGLFGFVWNAGALLSFGTRMFDGAGPAPAALVAVAFGALGCLPAVVVHALIEGRETAGGRRVMRAVIVVAYGLSLTAAVMHLLAAARGEPVPSRPALWLLTAGFTAVTVSLLVATRRQPIGRRGIWVAALAVFSVSALHFGRHNGDEAWWVELIGHHASLPLALAILHQDYRFALADLFLKNAIALLLLMGVSLGVLSGFVVPLMHWQDASGGWDPRAVALLVVLWMATAVVFPPLKRLANRLVDRAVLRRPDYEVTLAAFAAALETAEVTRHVTSAVGGALESALGASDHRLIPDPLPEHDPRLVVTGSALRALSDPSATALLRLRTVEPPHPAIVVGAMTAGRRLLSDDVRLLETISRLAARRIDALRVAQERLEYSLREQRMQRLAREAELRALRAQLNPHFLFNALTTIGHLVQTAPSRAVDTLLRLTHVLRGVLRRSSDEFSTLGEEVDLLRSYLDIEQARFEERLRVTIDVPAALRGATIPTLLLQPLVENAVKHGLSSRRAGCALTISAAADGARLRVSIADTGVGFEPTARGRRRGVGLTNVEQRLAAHYGAAASFRIDSAPGRGTTVTVVVPDAKALATVAAG